MRHGVKLVHPLLCVVYVGDMQDDNSGPSRLAGHVFESVLLSTHALFRDVL